MNIFKRRAGQANKATIWTIVALIVVVTAGLIIASIYSSGQAGSNTAGFTATVAPAITNADWSIGNPDAKVTLIEYGDFECPACGEYYPVVQQLIQNYSSTVRFVFRNFPLYSIHPFAGIGAQAAEAAGALGGTAKYWAMNDALYEHQADWSTNSALTPEQVVSQYFNGYAQTIGLNVSQFDAEINATSVLQKIQDDVSGGSSAQIDHTPTFFVNLTQIPNPTSMQDFENTLNAAVAASAGSSASGTSAANTSTVNVSTTTNIPITVTSTGL